MDQVMWILYNADDRAAMAAVARALPLVDQLLVPLIFVIVLALVLGWVAKRDLDRR